MDPIYFGSRLTAYEAAAYVRGLARRRRASWEQARYIAFYAAAPHCKREFTFETMGKFSWEEDNNNTEQLTEEWFDEIAKLRERAVARDKCIGLDDEAVVQHKKLVNGW